MADQELIDEVLRRIQEDVYNGDVTAIEALISNVPEADLRSFLPEPES